MLPYKKSLYSIGKSLTWNKYRLKTLKSLIRSFIKNRTVNLTLASTTMGDGTKATSEYRKLQRFFKDFEMPLGDIGVFILSIFHRPKNGWKVVMDRTNWKFGETHINILTVGIVVNGIAIPVVWKVLPQTTKSGNSNTSQRIEIIQKLLTLIPATDIEVLTMDREFCGNKWLKWLDDQGIIFIVRLKRSHKINGIQAYLFHKSKDNKVNELQEVWGLSLYFSGKKINKGRDPYLYIVSNGKKGKEALKEYKLRWSIELLFSHYKKRGFNLEDTHMSEDAKLERLFGVITLSFAVTFSWGNILTIKEYLNATEKRKSVFRLGLESLMRILDREQHSSSKASSLIQQVDQLITYSFQQFGGKKTVV